VGVHPTLHCFCGQAGSSAHISSVYCTVCSNCTFNIN
jgi:hypothetical protein